MLGLDLQGGTSIVLAPVKGSDLSTLDTAVPIIRNRVDGLGIAEPDVSRQGNNIVIDLPGVKNAAAGRPARRQDRRAAVPRGARAQSRTRARLPAHDHDHDGQGRDHDDGQGRDDDHDERTDGATTTTTAPAHDHDAGPRRARSARSTPCRSRPCVRGRRDHVARDRAGHHDRDATATTVKGATTTTVKGATTTTTASRPRRHVPGRQDGHARRRRRTSRSILPDTQEHGCYVARPDDPHRPQRRHRRPRSSTRRPRAWEVNVHFKNNDFVTKVATAVRRQAGRDRARRRRAVGADDQPGHHRPGRHDQRQRSRARRRTSSRSCCGTARCRCSSTPQTAQSVSPTLGKDQLQGRHRRRPHRSRARRALHDLLLPAARPRRVDRHRAHRA